MFTFNADGHGLTSQPSDRRPSQHGATYHEEYGSGTIRINNRTNRHGTTFTAEITLPGKTVYMKRFEYKVDACTAARNLIDGNMELIPWHVARRSDLFK